MNSPSTQNSHTNSPEIRYYTSALQRVNTPKHAQKLALVTALLLVFVVLFFVYAPWVQNVVGSGTVTSFVPNDRPQTIQSQISARIQKWYVNEGANVQRGDTIALLQDINVGFMSQDFLDNIKEVQRNTISAQENAIAVAAQRTAQALQRVEAAQASLENAKVELATARIRFDRASGLAKQGLSSTRDLETATLSLQKSMADSIRSETSLRSAKQDLEALRKEQNRIEQSARATIAEVNLRAANAEQRKSASIVIAPVSGQVTRISQAGPGETVKEGDLLAVIVPETTDQAAEIYVSSMDAALIDVGRQVQLQFSGFPAVQFSGWPGASIGVFSGKVAVVDAVDDGSGRYRVLVIPDSSFQKWPPRTYLRQGTEVTGWVMLSEVSIGYELWRILNGFPPIIPAKAEEEKKKITLPRSNDIYGQNAAKKKK